MIRRSFILAASCLCLIVLALAGGSPAGAVPPDPLNDGTGKQWRQLYETTGLTWNQVAAVCPLDGATACTGSVGPINLTGWTWATAPQVVELFGVYAPAILTADPPAVGGPEYFLPAAAFAGELRWTFYFALTYQFGQRTEGWTSSTDEGGTPLVALSGYGFNATPNGTFAVGPAGSADTADQARGVWLWRSAAGDHSPPAIASSVSGTTGANGWYVSDVSVTWDVSDADSAVTEQTGCDPASVTSDTVATSFACSATSEGGSSSASVSVKRDVTPPTVTCGARPVFELFQIGVSVPASVADATSGPLPAVARGVAITSKSGSFMSSVTGTDAAGNRTTQLCPYSVVVPTCRGLAPTRVGTAGNDVINGTNSRDVIVGLAGADTINGLGGDDVICGGDGPDTIDGGDGNDWIDGQASPDSIRGGAGTDTCLSGETRMSSCEL